jgi:hypothetical protein
MNTEAILQDLGADVVTTTSPLHALELVQSRSDFTCVVSDFAMPKMTGAELFSRCRASRPELPFCDRDRLQRDADFGRKRRPPGQTFYRSRSVQSSAGCLLPAARNGADCPPLCDRADGVGAAVGGTRWIPRARTRGMTASRLRSAATSSFACGLTWRGTRAPLICCVRLPSMAHLFSSRRTYGQYQSEGIRQP